MQKSSCWCAWLCGALALAACGETPPATERPVGDVLVRTDPASTAECPHGGTIVRSGLDDDGDGVLDDSEASVRTVLCNNPPVKPPPIIVVRLVPEPAGANCAEGGTAVQSGPDDNGNGALDDDEVAHTDYVCGRAVLTRLVAEPAGANCVAGGVAFLVGLDSDGDGELDDAEVKQTEYECSEILSRDVTLRSSDELAALANIRVINGFVVIERTTLEEISLPRLEQVNRSLSIGRNPQLRRIHLPRLHDAGEGGLSLVDNAALDALELPALRQLERLSIREQRSLRNLDGLAALVEAARGISIIENTVLESAELPDLALVGGTLEIRSNPALTALAWSIAGRLEQISITGNGLETLDLTVFEGSTGVFSLGSNPALKSANLELQRTGSATVGGNDELHELVLDAAGVDGDVTIRGPGLRRLVLSDRRNAGFTFSIGGSLVLAAPVDDSLQALPSDPLEIGGSCTIDGTQLTEITFLRRVRGQLQIINNPQLTGRVTLLSLGSGVVFNDNAAMQSLLLSAVQSELPGSLTIARNAALTTIEPSNLTRIGGTLTIDGNPSLLTTPPSLTLIAGDLVVRDNASLTDIGLALLESVDEIGIEENPGLRAIGLPALTRARRILVLTNPALRSLGVPALTTSQLTVTDNVVLPACAVAALFERIEGEDFQSGNDETATCAR